MAFRSIHVVNPPPPELNLVYPVRKIRNTGSFHSVCIQYIGRMNRLYPRKKNLQKKRNVIIYLIYLRVRSSNYFVVINSFNGMNGQLKIGYVRFGSGEKVNSFLGIDILFRTGISTLYYPLVQGLTVLRDDACDD
jgi:hypothetical protein